jgi:inner membrane protein
MAVLPAALAGAMFLGDRFLRRRPRPPERRARFGALLLLAYVSVLSHPLLDFLNTYGMRFLAPFSWRWYYGDALFIVDPWVWIVFTLGVAFSRVRARRGRPRPETPARIALGAVAVYALAMVVSSFVGRGIVGREAARSGFAPPQRVMISPVPLDPFRRFALVEEEEGYRFGSLLWKPRAEAAVSAGTIPKNDADPAAVAASRTPEGRKYLAWARFPFYEVRRRGASATVTIRDARYSAREGSWSTVTVVVPDDGRPPP